MARSRSDRAHTREDQTGVLERALLSVIFRPLSDRIGIVVPRLRRFAEDLQEEAARTVDSLRVHAATALHIVSSARDLLQDVEANFDQAVGNFASWLGPIGDHDARFDARELVLKLRDWLGRFDGFVERDLRLDARISSRKDSEHIKGTISKEAVEEALHTSPAKVHELTEELEHYRADLKKVLSRTVPASLGRRARSSPSR